VILPRQKKEKCGSQDDKRKINKEFHRRRNTQKKKKERKQKGSTTGYEDWKRSIFHYHQAHANILGPVQPRT